LEATHKESSAEIAHKTDTESSASLLLGNAEETPLEFPAHRKEDAAEASEYGILNKPVRGISKMENDNEGNFNADSLQHTAMPPTIKISIGKIEVRAVKASQKMPVKPKTQPELKMSLEDYIEKRK
jgi:hypothetical protein